MALTLEDITDGMCRTPALIGSAYLTVNGGEFGGGFALALGAYAIWDAYVYPERVEEADKAIKEIPLESRVEGRKAINQIKIDLANTRLSYQCLCALYGTMYGHQGYVHDDLGAGFAGVAIGMGYLGLMFQSISRAKKLEREQAIYTNKVDVKHDRRTKS